MMKDELIIKLKEQLKRARCEPVNVEVLRNRRVYVTFNDIIAREGRSSTTTIHDDLPNAIDYFEEIGNYIENGNSE